jgi:hypothetical protein
MSEARTLPWVAFLRRRAECCRRLALMQRDPGIAQALEELSRRYEKEAGVAATHAALLRVHAR